MHWLNDGELLALTEQSSDAEFPLVNLTELRGNLTKYLDDFVEKRGPFPKPNRPLDLKHLKPHRKLEYRTVL